MILNPILNIDDAKSLLEKRNRYEEDLALKNTIEQIRENVIKHGDNALKDYTAKFDGVTLDSLFVTDDELNEAVVSEELSLAIKTAYRNIELFHAEQFRTLQNRNKIETTKGVFCWRKFTPIDAVGLYVPSGSAPLFSTVLMTSIPAKIAGCKEIIIATPPQKNGKVHPAILFTAKLCGVKKILKVGGAQAIFALAYGTQSVPRVFKIFGPGNKFVDGAKQIIQSHVAIDMPAGPSEVMIICDETSSPKVITSDVLSQLEHDPSASSVLICDSKKHIEQINNAVLQRVKEAPRKGILEKSIMNYHAILSTDFNKTVNFINDHAPEHLIINTGNYQDISKKVNNAGSVFLGKYSAETIGDYASGTNHTLPTNGFAKAFSGLSVESFGKFVTFQEVTKEGFQNIGNTVKIMAESEELFEHASAIVQRNDSE